MAHKKGQGASRNGRDSNAQRRGIKCYEGETVQPGSIILRQCGSKFVAGRGTRMGMNFDIYSVVNGTVKYQGKKVHILPFGGVPVQGSPTRSTKAAKPVAPAAK